MIPFTKYPAEEMRILRSLKKINERLSEIENEAEYMTEAGSFCLRHVAVISSSVRKAAEELKRSGIDRRNNRSLFAWAGSVVKDGNSSPSMDDVLLSLKETDEDRMLLMTEISHAQNALICEAGKVYEALSEKILEDEEERLRAEKWIDGEETTVPGDIHSHVFFEYAFKLAAEKDKTYKKDALEKRLLLMGRNEGECIRIFTNEQSSIHMRLENLIGIIYTSKNIDWEKAFYEVSYTERMLSKDPSGLYQKHDDESKSLIRQELQELCLRCGLSERAAAAAAVNLVREKQFDNVVEVLFTDNGRSAVVDRLNGNNEKIFKRVPDVNGSVIIQVHLYTIIAFIIICVLNGFLPLYALFASIPLLWTTVKGYINKIILKITRTNALLRLKMDTAEENARTIVIVPALITEEESARKILYQIETYGVHEENENVDFLLLADFADSKNESERNDNEIREAILRIRNAMNARAGRRKYYYLHRKREYNKSDKVWMGRERKRGAIEDFNLLAIGFENRFLFEGGDADEIRNKYVYAITVDTDTQMIPGTIRKLIGAIHHPLNKKYNVIQPRMELISEKCESRFAAFLAGSGGSDIYNACAQDLYQDFTGSGLYNGKGIYRIREFLKSTYDVFEENSVLSHDLIEGILAGCGYAGDIVLYEGFPKNTDSYLRRLDRWTRGDWQLLKYALGKIKLRNLDRYKIFDNVLRSLSDASVLLLLLLSAWTGNTGTLILAGILFLLPYVSLKPDIANLFARICMLPDTAYTSVKAASKAIYRMLVSHKNMLSWMTADEADRGGNQTGYTGLIYSMLLIPAVFTPVIGIISAFLAGFFIFGYRFLREEKKSEEEAFTLTEYAFLTDLAESTWKYFEKHVKLGKTAFPPDNVQLDPPKGAAMRTSPTNIAMYISAVIAAQMIDLINESEMHARLKETAKEIEKLSKWRGLLYNWYDLNKLKPMHPRYVSSVDCGNLIAAYVLARNRTKISSPEISEMYSRLISEAEIERLYDESKKLFRIGYDAEKDLFSQSYYDLIASESRILSYTAMAEKNIDVKHWYSLSRPCERFMGECVLKSWSGTMFEYLMPFLFLPSAKRTLMKQTADGVIALQKKNAVNGIWGISESGYMSFDGALNYQYKAFGIRELALSGESTNKIIAPYAAVLALPVDKRKTIKNLINMRERKLIGAFGFYEAIDYTASESGETVFSFMAHHQGMALCAMANALTDNGLQKVFMDDAKEEAFRPCLNEKPFSVPLIARREKNENDENSLRVDNKIRERNYLRRFSEKEDTHFLISNDTEVLLNDLGMGFLRRNGIYANTWKYETDIQGEKLIPEIYVNGKSLKMKGGEFAPGTARYFLREGLTECEIICTLSPETGALIMKAECRNNSAEAVEAVFKQGFKVGLCDEESIFAHPVFKDLFIERHEKTQGRNVFKKKRREEDEKAYTLIHTIHGTDKTDTEDIHPKRGVYSYVSGKSRIEAFGKLSVYFEIEICENDNEEEIKAITEKDFTRAKSLSAAFNRTLLVYSGLNAYEYRSTELVIGRIFTLHSYHAACEFRDDTLWPIGLPGDRVICLAIVKDNASLPAFRKLLRAYEFMRQARITIPLVIVHVSEVEYFTPLKDKVETMLAASSLSRLRGAAGGVYVFSENELTDKQLEKLRELSVITVKKDFLKDSSAKRKTREQAYEKELIPMHTRKETGNLLLFNGYGGFDRESGAYEIIRTYDMRPKTAWANFLVNPSFGAIVTDRGIGCIWHGNSREGRITPYDNDPEDKSQKVNITLETDGKICSVFPKFSPAYAYSVMHSVGETVYALDGDSMNIKTTVHADSEENVLICTIEIVSGNHSETHVRLKAEVDFLMGTDERDKRFLKTETTNKIQLASGRKRGCAFAGFKEGDHANTRSAEKYLSIRQGESKKVFFLIGYAENVLEAVKLFSNVDPEKSLENTRRWHREYNSRILFSTGDAALDCVMNGFVKHQTLASRIRGKCGFYQPGGAVGFRDQLQDMLAVMYFDPEAARKHILNCAAHQFAEGDAMHWWHEPSRGVRTKISDDVLFLAYVTAKYVNLTGDTGILDEKVFYLKSMPIPEGKDDVYFEGEASECLDTLRAHIMAAFRKVYRKGAHGLLLMGSGDWNDGMNKVGLEGKGESVWLSEFMIVCAKEFYKHAADSDKEYLSEIIKSLKSAVEKNAWDGEWYLRAFNDKGEKIGSSKNRECRIDLISQAWAVLAELDEERSLTALKSAKALLSDDEAGLIRLLAPPFEGIETDPGYISKYPKGVRENGGQYTHAACWYVKALAVSGFANEAWKAFDMLLPIKRTDTYEKATRYMAEPYVIAADISGGGEWKGVGGWTWYTGAAAWTFCVLLEDLLGVKIEGNKITMRPLLPDHMNSVTVRIKYGSALYRLTGTKDAGTKTEPITLLDDGKTHDYVFPARKNRDECILKQE